MQILKCHEAEAYGRQLGEKAASFTNPKFVDPDWQIRDTATRNLQSWITIRQGAEIGAYDAFRKAFNQGFGRKVFAVESP